MTGNDNYLLIEELERRLSWYRDEATEEEFDAEEVDAICTMLQKLSPIKEPHRSKEEAYQNIMRRIREEEAERNAVDEVDGSGAEKAKISYAVKEKDKKSDKRKKFFLPESKSHRVAIIFIAVFVGAVVSLNMVIYARENKSLFTMILEKVGLLEIVKENEEEHGFVERNDKFELFYDEWTKLGGDVKSKIVVPQYIPEEYLLYGIRFFAYNNRKKVYADYYNKKNGHLFIEITLWESDEDPYREMAVDEEVYTMLSEYSDENTLYYVYEDEYLCMFVMGNNFYRISGNLELEEIIKVVEGIK